MFPDTKELGEHVMFMRDEGLSPSWIRNILKAIKHLCNFLEIDMPDVKAPPDNGKRIVYLTELEASRLLHACTDMRDYAMLCVLLYGGLRRKEVTLLKWSDIDFEGHIITVTGSKTHLTADIPISKKAIDALAMWRKRCTTEHVFAMQPDRVSRIVNRCGKRARLRKHVTPHVLRHTLATNLLINGADITLVQKQLRHRNIQSTLIYTHITTEKQKELYDRFSPDF